MATTVNPSPGARTVRDEGGLVASASDRSRDFRRARRHTLFVAALRYALPVAALAILGYFGLTVLHRTGWGVSVPSLPVPKILPENLSMNNPRYEGFSPDGGRFEVKALTAQQDFANLDVVKLNGISGVMYDAAEVRTDLKAGTGHFNSKTQTLDLSNSVDIVSSNGMTAKLSSATVLTKESIITSNQPVAVEMTAGRVRANEMKLRHKTREVTFVGAVQTHLEAAKRPGAKPEQPAGATPAQPFGASDAPIDITSNRLDINDTTKLAVFSGGVRAVQAGATLTSPDLQVTYSGQAPGLGAPGQPQPASTGLAEPAGKVKRIVASGPVEMVQASGDRATAKTANFDAEAGKAFLDGDVVMTQAPDRRATADRAELDQRAEKALLVGNVVMTQAPDRRAVSDRAELDQRAETVVLVGNVVVSQGRNILKGRRLQSDRKAGHTRVTSPNEDGGDGRIAARFFRDGPASGGTGKSPQANATGGGFGAGTFKTDPNAPVDINSDSLDINDPRKTAVFRGDVLAVQGGFKMRTAELTAFYSGEAGLGGGTAVAAKDTAAKGGAELQRIEARKSVVVQSQDGQTATGDWANFDTKRNLVVVGGDVVLTQGPNVIRGSRLNIDMTTGQSTIETEPAAGWSARAQPAGDGKSPPKTAIDIPPVPQKSRPSAVFYPKNLKDKADASKAAKNADAKNADAKNAGAWGPVTRPARERDN